MSTKNLLVELFVEELPPKALKKLGESFSSTLCASLQAQGLAPAGTHVTPYASPRRLAAHITDVVAQAADKPVSQKLMPVSVGLDANGQPTQALLKKLAALGADASVVPSLKRESDGKAELLFLDSVMPGARLADGLQKALEEALAKLPIPKVMTYQLEDGWTTVNFVRPAHGLVALHGGDVVPVHILGLASSNLTQGHRFEAARHPVMLKDADGYAAQMEQDGAVIAGFAARRAEIARQLAAAGASVGLTPIDDDALLDEVTALVERPNVLVGQFEETFLEVPQECLILTMKANQKYFPLLDANSRLTNKFLIVSNIRPADTSAVVGGNERVVRPRLSDAKFFFDQDRKKPLQARVAGLDKVVYHNKLGSQGERMERVRAIARAIAQQLGGEHLAVEADLAAQLAKADLLTDMVGEFPELQGIMGRHYALHDGLSHDIADAIEDHYKPRFAGDELPRNNVGLAVALADKLETLVGLFGIGEKPTGEKDPFALRRHALGIIRIVIEKNLPLRLDWAIEVAIGILEDEKIQATCANRIAAESVAKSGTAGGDVSKAGGFVGRKFSEDTKQTIADFIFDRLSSSLREQGYTAQEVDAVLALHPQRLADVKERLEAVRSFSKLPEAESLAAANKRIRNILKKVETAIPVEVDVALLAEAAEKDLFASVHAITPEIRSLLGNEDYTDALTKLAGLRAPVDRFFDDVMVMTDEPLLRQNRLALLNALAQLMNGVADISRLAA